MDGLSPIALALLTGFISGLLLSIPVGPINLTIINEGARRGFKWAALIGLGAVVMEVIYCFVAFTSFASFFRQPTVKASMELMSFIFMLYLGIRFLIAKPSGAAPMPVPLPRRLREKFAEEYQPHSAFMTGFVRVMGNPGVLGFWIVLATKFMARGWVDPAVPWTRLCCVGGVAGGTGVWFLGLSSAVSVGHRKFSPKTLVKMERGSGVVLLGIAVADGIYIIGKLAQQHHI